MPRLREAVNPLKCLAAWPVSGKTFLWFNFRVFATHETPAGQILEAAAARRYYRRVGRHLWSPAAGTAACVRRPNASDRIARRADDACARDRSEDCGRRAPGHRRAFK